MGSFEWMEVETLSTEINALEERLEGAKSRHNYGLVKIVKVQIAAAQQRRARYLAHISTSLAESLEPSAPPRTAQEVPQGLPQEHQAEISGPDQPDAETAGPIAQEAQAEAADPDQPNAEPADAVASEAQDEAADPDQSNAELAGPIAQEAQAESVVPDQPNAEAAVPIAQEAQEKPGEPDRPSAEPGDPATASRVRAPTADMIKGVTNVWDQLTPAHIERAKHEVNIRRAEILARHAEELKALEADQGEIDMFAQAVDAFVRKFNAASAGSSVVKLDDERDRLQSQS